MALETRRLHLLSDWPRRADAIVAAVVQRQCRGTSLTVPRDSGLSSIPLSLSGPADSDETSLKYDVFGGRLTVDKGRTAATACCRRPASD
jgi:hypothetical protein